MWWLDQVALALGWGVLGLVAAGVLLGLGVLYVWCLQRLLRWWRV